MTVAFPSQDSIFSALKQAMAVDPQVEQFYGDFDVLKKPGIAQILHLQWPEELLGWEQPAAKVFSTKLMELQLILEAWREAGSMIIITRHNRRPHTWKEKMGCELYNLVYSKADAVIHCSQASLQEFTSKPFVAEVIPLSIFEDFPDRPWLTQKACRINLNLPLHSSLILVFGRIREVRESRFMLDCFQRLPPQVPPQHLWVACSSIVLGRNRLSQWLTRKYLQGRTDITLATQRHTPEVVEQMFRAADVVFLPRFASLSSGPIIQALSWGVVAVGPDDGAVGESLRRVNNPVFKPGCVAAAVEALAQGLKLSTDPQVLQKNRQYAQENWKTSRCLDLHLSFYKRLLSMR